mmetsp:Transcript_31807/g.81817  ORF Transcript_31807/g.81817 Transcript_31807/m.81817 type:complete len:372 (+) Transcript_31807:975-2090(+)
MEVEPGVRATIVVVGVPQPRVVQDHIITVDLHHGVCTDDWATSVVEGAHTRKDIRQDASGGSTKLCASGRSQCTAVGAHLCSQIVSCSGALAPRDPPKFSGSPTQQRSRRTMRLGRAGLEEQAGNANIGQAICHLNSSTTRRRYQRREAQTQHHETRGVDDEGPDHLVHARSDEQPLLSLDASVHRLSGVAWFRNEDIAFQAELPLPISRVVHSSTHSGIREELRHIDVPSGILLLHQVRLLGNARSRRDCGDLGCDPSSACLVGLRADALDPDEDVVPTVRAPNPSRHIRVAEEPLLLHASHDSAFCLHIRHEAAAGEARFVGEPKLAVDDGASDGRTLGCGPSHGRTAEGQPLERSPEVVCGMTVGTIG